MSPRYFWYYKRVRSNGFIFGFGAAIATFISLSSPLLRPYLFIQVFVFLALFAGLSIFNDLIRLTSRGLSFGIGRRQIGEDEIGFAMVKSNGTQTRDLLIYGRQSHLLLRLQEDEITGFPDLVKWSQKFPALDITAWDSQQTDDFDFPLGSFRYEFKKGGMLAYVCFVGLYVWLNDFKANSLGLAIALAPLILINEIRILTGRLPQSILMSRQNIKLDYFRKTSRLVEIRDLHAYVPLTSGRSTVTSEFLVLDKIGNELFRIPANPGYVRLANWIQTRLVRFESRNRAALK